MERSPSPAEFHQDFSSINFDYASICAYPSYEIHNMSSPRLGAFNSLNLSSDPSPWVGGTKRKYGERASSCASSAGSMDARLSENFGTFHTNRNTPPPSQPPRVGNIMVPSPLATRARKKRREAVAAQSKSSGHRDQSPRLPNTLNSYFKIRGAIREAFSHTPSAEPIDQSSSCASIPLSGVDLPTSGELTAKSINLTKLTSTRKHQLLSRMKVAVVKWRSRKRFFELTSDLQVDDEQSATHAWRRRRTVVGELLSTSVMGEEWAALVVRRFTKTTARQIAGLRAILKLHVTETTYHSSPEHGRVTRVDSSSQCYKLLELVFVQNKSSSFSEEVVPAVLRDWSVDKPHAIVWLVQAIPPLMSCIDGEVVWRYGRQVIQKATPWTTEWMDGIWLLTALFLDQFTLEKDRRTIFSAAKFIFHVGMEALGSRTFDISWTTQGHSEISPIRVLSLIVLICLRSEGGESLHAIVPSEIILKPFVEACVDAVCDNGPITCSALKALALLRDIPTAMEDIPTCKTSLLTTCCTEIVLGRGLWKNPLLIEKCPGDPYPLIPEEDAFDILCRLPQPRFPRALAAALADCPISLAPSSQDHFNLFEMLEPLLWLSNMPNSIPEAHRALVDGGAVDFLAQVILDSPRETWVGEDRAVWRLKGDAVTCLGRIIEKMDEADLRARVKEDVIRAVVEIKENQEAPLFQREQATVMLQRYKTTADRCGIVPFCAEMLGQESGGSKSVEGPAVEAVPDVVPAL